jgi:hypothetical protein
MTYQARSRPSLWLGMILGAILLAAIACHSNDVSHIHIKLQDTPAEKQAASPRLATPTPLPSCPAGGVPSVQSSASGVGDHKVFLKWKASVPSTNVTGYCLYRTTNSSSAKNPPPVKTPNCLQCEQINLAPISGTSCVDDVVKDGATYHYVAAAINQSRLSSSSNAVTVVIPQSKQPVGSAPAGTYPPCRGPSSASPSPSSPSANR